MGSALPLGSVSTNSKWVPMFAVGIALKHAVVLRIRRLKFFGWSVPSGSSRRSVPTASSMEMHPSAPVVVWPVDRTFFGGGDGAAGDAGKAVAGACAFAVCWGPVPRQRSSAFGAFLGFEHHRFYVAKVACW